MVLFERASKRWWTMRFASKPLETLYNRLYAYPQLKSSYRFALIFALLTVILWSLFHTIVSDSSRTWLYHLASVLLVAFLLVALCFIRRDKLYKRFYHALGFATIFVLCSASLLASCMNDELISPLGSFVVSIQLILLIYLALPCPLYMAIGCALMYSILYEILIAHNYPYEFTGVKFVLLICFHVLGAHLFVLSQVRERKSFIKLGQSLLVRQDLEKEKRFIDNMIESVMPKKVAEELLKGTNELRRPSSSKGDGRGSIFRPFTMNLMTNVSILFADIAGFTKMSSNKSAEELVDLLNDLFGRFDRLCTATGCEKISTLGDCYYCVSGCPEPRSDHARCCVEMGLAMCQAIKQFDVDRNQDVNMRVGIHTGTVMCGIVGTRRFKFDVFSNDVSLANTMESSGRAGSVHISETTKNFLTAEYELEDSDPISGLKTYFIVPPPPGIGSRTQSSASNAFNKPLTQSSSLGHSSLSASVAPSAHQTPLATAHYYKVLQSDNLRHIDSSEIDIDNETNQYVHGSNFLNKLFPTSSPRHRSTSMSSLTRKLSRKSKVPREAASTGDYYAGNSGQQKIKAGSVNSLSNGAGSRSPLESRRSKSAVERPDLDLLDPEASKMDFMVHATSITRFDTAHMDFDQRLVDCIESYELNVDNIENALTRKTTVLNPWTLCFNDEKIEREYRRHFLGATFLTPHERTTSSSPDDIVDAICRRSIGGDAKVDETFRVTSPKYSVYIDVLVAFVTYSLIMAVSFAVFGIQSIFWLTYCCVTALIFVVCFTYVTYRLFRYHSLPDWLTGWLKRHVTGAILINLPLGAALSNLICILSNADSSPTPNNTSHQLVALYIIFVVLYLHCNFSQLNYSLKSFLTFIIAIIVVSLIFSCLCDCSSDFWRSLNDVYTPGIKDRANVSTLNLSFLASNFWDQSRRLKAYTFTPTIFNGNWVYRAEIVLLLFLSLLLIVYINRQFERNFRLSYFGDKNAYKTIQEMYGTKQQADWLLYNIVPHHIQDQLMQNAKYSENHEMIAVVFATIINWHEMYEETYERGREFLRVLNELVADFDELLARSEFVQVEKIKTIGTTYMAASGLNTGRRRLSVHPYSHLYELMEFAIALLDTLENFNKDILNFEFKMKIGYNIGPVTAGVIGTTKLYYDIWGDTVNVASRMYSTGVAGRIQVSRKARDMLQDVYEFEYRDHIEVKGIDGGMEVFLLKNRRENMIPKLRPWGLTSDDESTLPAVSYVRRTDDEF